jgi:hypothetical protein
MKFLLMIVALMSVGLASAKEIRCESAADASLYLSNGKIEVRAPHVWTGPLAALSFVSRKQMVGVTTPS